MISTQKWQTENTLSSQVYTFTFSRTDHTSWVKSRFTKFKKIEIISNTSFPTTALWELEINYEAEKTEKHRNTWKLNNKLLNNQKSLKIKKIHRGLPGDPAVKTCLPVQLTGFDPGSGRIPDATGN